MRVGQTLLERNELRGRLRVRPFGKLGQACLSFLDRFAGFPEPFFLVEIASLRKQRAQGEDFRALLGGWRSDERADMQANGNDCREKNQATKQHDNRSTPRQMRAPTFD